MWKTSKPLEQHLALAEQFHNTVEPLARHGVPLLFLSFPRLVDDCAYFCATLGPMLEQRYGIQRTELEAAHAAEARPDLVSIRGPEPAE